MSKRASYMDLFDAINVEVTVECQSCEKIDGDWDVDAAEFSQYLFKKGWRLKDQDVLCPKCVKKLKKAKK